MGPCQHSNMPDRAGESVATRAWSRAVDSGGPHRTPQTPLLAVQASHRPPNRTLDASGPSSGHLSPRVRACMASAGSRLGPVSGQFRTRPPPCPARSRPCPPFGDPRHAPGPLSPCPDGGGGWPSRASAVGMRCPVPRVRGGTGPMSMSEGGMSLRSAREGAKGRRRRRGRGRCGAVGGLRPESGDGRRVGGWPGRWGHPPPGVGGIFGVPPRARRGSPRLTWTAVTVVTAVSVRVGSGCVDYGNPGGRVAARLMGERKLKWPWLHRADPTGEPLMGSCPAVRNPRLPHTVTSCTPDATAREVLPDAARLADDTPY